MSVQHYQDGTLRQSWDDNTRTYTEYDENGDVLPGFPRPYTAEENALADQAAQSTLLLTNEEVLISRAKAAIAANNEFLTNSSVQAYLDASATPTAAQTFAIVKIALRQIRLLTRAVTALIRLTVRDFTETTGTD